MCSSLRPAFGDLYSYFFSSMSIGLERAALMMAVPTWVTKALLSLSFVLLNEGTSSSAARAALASRARQTSAAHRLSVRVAFMVISLSGLELMPAATARAGRGRPGARRHR